MDESLRARFEAKYDLWRQRLLDIGSGNRLINFHATKVSTIRITSPSLETLYGRLVEDEASLKFPLYEGIEPV
ncbi:MAG: DUF4011 domain-containing protein, partial [Dehalococcoidia bacterium]